MKLPRSSSVRIYEVGLRDGLQNENRFVPTHMKLCLLKRLLSTGLRYIECTSFVSPKWVPQMADHREMMSETVSIANKLPYATHFPALVPNIKGYEQFRAVADPRCAEVAVFISSSEGFSRRNINKSIEESLNVTKKIVDLALKDNYKVRAYLSTVIACPYDGDTEPRQVASLTKALASMGCYEVSLGDTIGVGTPERIETMLNEVLRDVDEERLAIHAHDTFGQGVSNSLRAVEMGIRTIDASIAGLGGCPYAKGATGNVATQDVVKELHSRGYSTGVNLESLMDCAEQVKRVANNEAPE